MSDFATIKARIASEMHRGELSASASAVQAAVLSAIDCYKRRRFYFNEFNDEVATCSSSATYMSLNRFSVGSLDIDSVKMIITNRDYPLSKATWNQLDSVDAGQFYGYPDYFAIHADKFRFYPPPNAEYEVKVSGVKELTEISANAAGSATNAWVDDAEEMIRYKAKANLFRDHLRDYNSAERFEMEAQRSYRELRKEVIAKTSAGKLRPTQF